LDYIIYMIQFTFSDFNISNEAEFKVNFYAENDSPAALFKWWDISGENIPNRYGWKSEVVTQTALGKPLVDEYKRFKMRLRFNNSYKLESSTFDYNRDEKPRNIAIKPQKINKPKKTNLGYEVEVAEIPNSIECSSYCNSENNSSENNNRGGYRGRGGRGGYRGRYQKKQKDTQ
jgi:hypothetical protein